MAKLDRRDFLKAAGAFGLWVVSPRAHAQDGMGADAMAPAKGPYWLFFHASGGWDPTSFCDPKGAQSEMEENPMNHYLAADIRQAGNIPYAPVGTFIPEFFEKHHSRLTVINGIDTATNSHDVGTRHIWSGKLAEGYPTLAALIASTQAPTDPMSFVSFGGYDVTAGTIAPTRLGNVNAVGRIAFPNSIDGGPEGDTFHSKGTWERILAAQTRRRAYLESVYNLPKGTKSVGRLYAARSSENELKKLSEYLPQTQEQSNIKRQVQLAMACFKSGVAKTANLDTGGFDTHGNHDASHIPRLDELLGGVDFAWQEAERLGIADQVIILVGSDFGRTPGYNNGNGKDHWSVTSMLMMGAGIAGNRVVGKSDERHRALGVDPATLAPMGLDAGVRISPVHIHKALRKLAGISDAPQVTSLFPLVSTEEMPIFG